MVCQHCRAHVATIHIQKIGRQGEIRDQWLCADCAVQLGVLRSEREWVFGENSPYRTYRQKESVCPVCGMTYSNLLAHGAPGCSRCFTVFREQLLPVVQQLHGTVRHTGKQPGRTYALRVTRKQDHALALHTDEKRSLMLKMKQEELKKAVVNQEFEKAAQLRDEIRDMEEGTKA